MMPIPDVPNPEIVRISFPGGGGTGFFVSPGRVLTCAHVVRNAPDKLIRIHCLDRVFGGSLMETFPNLPSNINGPGDYPDLAVISVPDSPDLPCVAFEEGPLNLETRLHTRGFTTTWSSFPTEEPSTFTYEGLHNVAGGAFLKLTAGEAVPGMSGSPLVNMNTGLVCGVLKSSRALGTDQGGWGIPTEAFAKFFPETWLANQDFQAKNPTLKQTIHQVPEIGNRTVLTDVGSVRPMTQSGKPPLALFTVSNQLESSVKVSAIQLEVIECHRLKEPHFFLAEGLPEYFNVSAHLTPEQEIYDLIDLDHVLAPRENEGYRLEITGEEGWSFRVRLRTEWRLLGGRDKMISMSNEFNVDFKLMSVSSILDALREEEY